MFGTLYSQQPYRVLRSEVDRLFDDYLGTSPWWISTPASRSAEPALNMWEDADNYYLEAECPGLTIEDLNVSVMGNELSLSGNRRKEQQENAAYHRRERVSGKFSRVLALPCQLDPDHVEASLKNGILSIKLPKAAASKPRKITVNGQH